MSASVLEIVKGKSKDQCTEEVYELWSSVPTNWGGPAKNWIRDGSLEECRATAKSLVGKQFKDILEIL